MKRRKTENYVDTKIHFSMINKKYDMLRRTLTRKVKKNDNVKINDKHCDDTNGSIVRYKRLYVLTRLTVTRCMLAYTRFIRFVLLYLNCNHI